MNDAHLDGSEEARNRIRTIGNTIVIHCQDGRIQRVLVKGAFAEREGLVAVLVDYDHIAEGPDCKFTWNDVETETGDDRFIERGYVELPLEGCALEERGC